ncbi:MAG: hypothetical protein HKM89_09920, partial [Gemmatimonadales bacterium]|nr:hypothetical protein [Gemmatimonadales bacterium]
LVLALATGISQQEPRTVVVGQVTALASPDQMSLAIALAEAASEPVSWPGLGRREPGPLRLIVLEPGGQLDSLSRGRFPPWSAGLAYPSARTVVVRSRGSEAFTVLRHELAHLALHEAVRSRLPLWFDEGYASWAAGEFDRLQRLNVNLAVLRGRIPNFDVLDRALRGPPTTAETAYALAATAVIELARRTRGGDLESLLDRLEEGEGFDPALRSTIGLTVDQFEVQWRRSIRRRYNLLTWIAAGGLWTLLGGLVLVAHFLRRRRDLPRRLALDEGWVIPEEAEVSPEA